LLDSLWKVQDAIDHINQTYELVDDLATYNYRTHRLFDALIDQTHRFACSGGVYTQTSDVEGEVNGLVTYDRRLKRFDLDQWKTDIQAMYDAATSRGGKGNRTMRMF